jgi:N utilization substance protein A
MRVAIIRVEKTTRGPQVIVSRADPSLVQHLFQTEVPEIYDGTVQIRSIAREAGERTKIAVTSRERDVDPVGACVGMKGSRVQSIIRELRGEKIDIIQWSDDIVSFATNAISPAQVSRVSTLESPDFETSGGSQPDRVVDRVMEIVVEDSQLSLAIGKKGQNVRLASKLIGWRIDIKSEAEKRAEIEDQIGRMQAPTPLESITGLTPGIISKLNSAEITTVEQLADMAPEDLESVPGIGGKTIDKIRDELSEYYAALPTFQDDLERSTQERMFAKDTPEPPAQTVAEPEPQAAVEAEPETPSPAEAEADEPAVTEDTRES